MPNLSIIPAAAVADSRLSDVHVRVLCAIGTHTNRLGGNVWASVATLAKESNVSERTVQRAIPVLIDAGYIRRTERVGRTNLYDVVLNGVTQESLGGDLAVTPPPTMQSPKRPKERHTLTEEQASAMDRIWAIFPKRTTPHLYQPFAEAYKALCRMDISPISLVRAAQSYALLVAKEGTNPKYIKTLHRFYADESWRAHCVLIVEGRTRDEWARSGQDVAEFDRLVGVSNV